MESDAKCVALDEIRKAIRFGVCKINIATDLRLLWTRIHREFFNDSPELFDPVIPGKIYIDEISNIVQAKCKSFSVLNEESNLLINEKLCGIK